jgi:uroporphyrinogen decarboxylase
MVEKLDNDLLLRAARGESIERYPVWIMRQAGRVLSEYKAVRDTCKDFVEFVKSPEKVAEVTVQPVDIFGVDAAIVFSDILTVPEAMGLPYNMVAGKGPVFPNVVNNKSDFEKLISDVNVEESLGYVKEGILLSKQALSGRVPLIGFAGAPWTIFCYMVEGSGSKTFSKAKALLYSNPELSHRLLEKITNVTIEYLQMQINAGVNLVQLFDSWAGILGREMYNEFGLRYIRKICEKINNVPVTSFAKGAYASLKDMDTLNCDTIGLDWNMDMQMARALFKEGKTLQGNLDPCVLYGSEKLIKEKTKQMLESFESNRHIVNLGHGLYPDMDRNKVKFFVNEIKEYEI